MDHPTPEMLRSFLVTRLSDVESDRVEAHLVNHGCERCLFAAREMLPELDFGRREGVRRYILGIHPELEGGGDRERGQEGLGQALRQTERFAVVVECERALAPQLIGELERRPLLARREAIRSLDRYQLFGLAETLCEASREAVFSDVVRAIELGELAVEVADCLDPALYTSPITADQRALARAILGNARRTGSDLFGAERAFAEGLPFLSRGTKAGVVQAQFRSLLGSLRIDQTRFGEAARVLDEARELVDPEDTPELLVRVALQLGRCAGFVGQPKRAVEVFREAAEQAEGLRDVRLQLNAAHNVSWYLVEAGDSLEALATYEKTRPLYDRFATDPWVQLRRRWLEGRIHAGLGDFETANQALSEVRAEASRRELGYEVAMVSLELALVYLDLGDPARVQELAEELTPVFLSQELHRHAVAAVYLFRDAARAQRATAGFVREVLAYLRRARNNPYLRFEPSAPWK